MKYVTKAVTDEKELKYLYDKSAFTLEGLAKDSISDFVDWLEANTTFTTDELIVYIISGATMNEVYGLKGSNAYSPDLTIVSVVDIEYGPIIFKRFSIGARWFDDIVDNNSRRN